MNAATNTDSQTQRGRSPEKPKLLDQVRRAIRVRHYSIRTEHSYVDWIRRYILFHNKRHPRTMGAPEINEFLSYLASDLNVASSTQNQALSAIIFLYKRVLEIEVGDLGKVVRAKRPARPPNRMHRWLKQCAASILLLLAERQGGHA